MNLPPIACGTCGAGSGHTSSCEELKRKYEEHRKGK